MKFGRAVVKSRHVILLAALLLMIPAVIGYVNTDINYDMLTYLPDDMETVQGQDLLMDEFGKGGFSIVVVENMKSNDVKELKEEISQVDHVDSVLNLQEVMDPSVPIEMYPDAVRENISNENASMLVVFFDTSTSAQPTLDAITEIRELCSDQCYVSGMSALVVDLKNLCEKEEASYVGLAVLLSLIAMMLLLDSYVVPFLFLASIGIAIMLNLGSNIMFGEISYITKAIAAVLQLGVTLDYSIFLWHSYEENLEHFEDHKEAMAEAINATLVSVTGSSITTIAGFLALCFMSYTMGMDLGLVMAKGVLFGVICSVTVLPSMLLLFDKVLLKTKHRSLIPDMSKIAKGLTSHFGIYICIFLLLIGPAIYGYTNKTVTYDFTNMLSGNAAEMDSEDTQFMVANQKLEEDFHIGTTHMILADANLPQTEASAMSNEIKNVDGVQLVAGIDSFLSPSIPKEMLPEEITDALIAGDKQLILVNSEYKVSTDECNNQIDEINAVLDKYDSTATLIGEGPATKDLITTTDKDFKVVSILSMVAVFFIIFFVLKSISLPFILIAVIELAIYINLGIPGYTGLELPFIVPICISTIQLGSTVDYAILMSTRYKTERMEGKDKREAVETSVRTSIPSILVSALGFFTATIGVSIYSNIGIISTFCTLMARGAIISMLLVILVLPSLFMAFDGLICKTTIGLRKKDREGRASTKLAHEGENIK